MAQVDAPGEAAAHFLAPDGVNRERMRALAYRAVDLWIDSLSGEGPLTSSLSPEALTAEVARPLPQQGVGGEEALASLAPLLRHALRLGHPAYFGHMDSAPPVIAVLGDLLASAWNQNLMAYELGPLAVALEQAVLGWLRDLLGLPPVWGGLLVSGGTEANRVAMTLACSRVGPEPPVVLLSEAAHFSFEKARRHLLLPKAALRLLPTDRRGRLSPAVVEEALRGPLPGRPVLLVGTLGTTSTGAVDPLLALSRLARRHGLWLHIDAALGGAAIMTRGRAAFARALRYADSVTFDPHKWLSIPKSAGALLLRDPSRLDPFAVVPPYLQREDAPGRHNPGYTSPQGSRRFDALKIHLALTAIGRRGYQALTAHDMAMARAFATRIRRHPLFELTSPPSLNMLTFRARPAGLSAEQTDRLNRHLQQALEASQQGFLSLTTVNGSRVLKAVFLNPFTGAYHLDGVLDFLAERTDRWLERNALSRAVPPPSIP